MQAATGFTRVFCVLGAVVLAIAFAVPVSAMPADWSREWPRTDFTKASVPLQEIVSGGPAKDGIPAIDRPEFVGVAQSRGRLPAREPVISVHIAGEARAYPLRILMWHEIVNDSIGGMPIAVTYCPLCDSSIVFDRRVTGRVLSFGTTGKLRHSGLVMYDRETESWWQQFLGQAIVGDLVNHQLARLPARIESFERFAQRFPDGKVMVPPQGGGRPYGANPYVGYDRSAAPLLYQGHYDDLIPPLARVVVVGDQAWPLDLLKERGRIEAGDLVLTWEPGQASALDAATIEAGRDIGNAVVQRRTPAGLEDVVYDVSFAFAFRAFHPNGRLHAG
ncbi:MAG: DUF3179 domain-containing protein [Alphaproteobacteria bacterium]